MKFAKKTNGECEHNLILEMKFLYTPINFPLYVWSKTIVTNCFIVQMLSLIQMEFSEMKFMYQLNLDDIG